MKTLTVSSLYRRSGPDHRPTHKRVPAVRLTGEWLTRHGFAAGAKFTVRVTGAALTLEVAQ
jgi:hypothetical protein